MENVIDKIETPSVAYVKTSNDVKNDSKSDRQTVSKKKPFWKFWKDGKLTSAELHSVEVENRVCKIIDILLESNDTKIIISPTNRYKFYIKHTSKKNDIIIVDAFSNVILTNMDSYPYTKLSANAIDSIVKKLQDRIQTELDELSEMMRANELDGLDRVLESLK